MNTISRYAININDGRIVYRTGSTDELRALYRKISNETAQAIFDSQIGAMDVVNAIMSEERYSGTFDWKEFKKAEQSLNMRQSDIVPEDAESLPEDQLKPDEPGEVMSLEDIKAKVSSAPKSARRGRPKKEGEPEAADNAE